MVEPRHVAAVAENGVIGHDGELPWPSGPADRPLSRERLHATEYGRLTLKRGERTGESIRR